MNIQHHKSRIALYPYIHAAHCGKLHGILVNTWTSAIDKSCMHIWLAFEKQAKSISIKASNNIMILTILKLATIAPLELLLFL